jgi:peptidylprolyl isomerase
VSYFNGTHRVRARGGLALTTVAVAIVIAGCGSSGNSSTITVGNQNPADNALLRAGSASTGPTGATTPASGPLSKEPTVTRPTGAPPTTLVKRDLIVGSGPEATAGQSVTVNYVGVLYTTGRVFDASWKRHEPFSFSLGRGQVIPGWDQGIAGMKVGGRRELIIPAPLAYGARGSPPAIPPNATLVFVVDLLAV